MTLIAPAGDCERSSIAFVAIVETRVAIINTITRANKERASSSPLKGVVFRSARLLGKSAFERGCGTCQKRKRAEQARADERAHRVSCRARAQDECNYAQRAAQRGGGEGGARMRARASVMRTSSCL